MKRISNLVTIVALAMISMLLIGSVSVAYATESTDTGTTTTATTTTVKVYVNDKEITGLSTVIIIGDEAYFVPATDFAILFPEESKTMSYSHLVSIEPIRTYAQLLGYELTIDSQTNTVKLTKNTTSSGGNGSDKNDQSSGTTTPNVGGNNTSTNISNSTLDNVGNTNDSGYRPDNSTDNSTTTTSDASGGTATNSLSGLNINVTNEGVNNSGVTISNSTLTDTTINNVINNEVNVSVNQVDSHTEEGQRADIAGGTEIQYQATVFVNDTEVKGTQCFIDQDGLAWLYPSHDLYLLFPAESAQFSFTQKMNAELVSSWAKMFGYTVEVKGLCIYLSNGEAANTEPVKLFIDGMYKETDKLYLDNSGNIRLKKADDGLEIFVGLTGTPELNDQYTYLQNWASFYGYSYAQEKNLVYLNRDGKKPIAVYLNNQFIDFPDQQPVLLGGRTMVPIRAIAEAMGWDVQYFGTYVIISNESHVVIMYYNSTSFQVDGVWRYADVAPQIYNNRTLVAVRFLSEALGCQVDWNGDGNIAKVLITK